MRTPYGILVLTLIALCLAATPVQAQEGSSAFDTLDAGQLANVLAQMHMKEMLEAFQQGLGTSGDSLRPKLIVLNSQKAMLDNASPQDRPKLINQVSSLYREVIELAGQEPEKKREQREKDKAILRAFDLRFEFGEFLGSQVIQNNTLNLLLLRGGQYDVDLILEKTVEAVKTLDQLQRDIEQTLQSWRGDPLRMVISLPKLEDLKKKVKYFSAWVYLNRGLALRGVADKKREREGLLRDAIVQANEFADGSEDSGVKYWALLLRGTALRELEEHHPATQSLQAAAACNDNQVRWRAKFELTRLAIESGDKNAKGAIDAFAKFALEAFGQEQKMGVDLLQALLTSYLYETQAAKAKDPKLLVEGHKALLAFANSYADDATVQEWCGIITNKYGRTCDLAKSNSMHLLGAGVAAMFANDAATGAQYLEKVVSRTDELSIAARPLALWYLAVLESQKQETLKAAQKFKDLAEKYPKHAFAPLAARNAVIAYTTVVQELRRANPGRPLGALLQAEYIGSLENLVNTFADKDPKAASWYLNLADEYRFMSEFADAGPKRAESRKKAVAAYEKVPPSKGDKPDGPTLYAKAMPLELRYLLWAEDLDKAAQATVATQLIRDLQNFGKEAYELLPDLKGRLASDLKEWGARAELRAGMVILPTDGTELRGSNVLKAIPQRWPGTVAEGEAIEFLISFLINSDKTDKAIDLLEDFRKTHPDRAGHLIQRVIQQIQVRIENFRMQIEKRLELNRFRGIYYNFTKDLFERVKDQPMKDRYELTQLYASGLVEKGYSAGAEAGKPFFQEALKLYQECETYDASRRGEKAKQIEKQLDDETKSVLDQAKDSEGDKKALEDYKKLLEKYQVDLSTISGPFEINGAIEIMDQSPAEEKARRQEKVVSEFKQHLTKLKEDQLRTIPSDAENLPGLARCNSELGDYSKAAEYYDTAVKGLEYWRTQPEGPDKDRVKKLYYRLLLEQCENILKGFSGKKASMESLTRRIKMLQALDAQMGGLGPQFDSVITRAQEALRTAH